MSEKRALLLTDVVDSTQLAERLGDAAAAELGAAHDRVARDLLRAWRGREIDKTDGMLMLFEQATDALGFAMAYHAALAALPVPLKARAGLHFGAVILRTNPPEDVVHGAKSLEVEGIAKPIAARVMSLALGGQTLLTAEARAALGDTALRVQSHGHWRIKGVAEPMELFETGDERAPFMPPPDSAKVYRVVQRDELWLPLREVAHGLPAERDVFVGRRAALAGLARRFEQGARLVSLLGVGGTGKTRLATRYGWTWLGDFPGGAWFCDLSSARGVDGIVLAVAQALGVPLGAGDPVQQLGHAIAGRGTCLLILDNFEQVARHAEDTLGRWLDRAPDARFLVTTREVLGLPGEQALALAPLDATEAAALFVRRAKAVKPDFAPGDDDCGAIDRLVRLLDGLPLAIELAAARVRVMSPRTLLGRMDQRFKLLAASGGRRDRQATLRATFDWSWELLSDAEKSALAQLSVFEGGFTLEAVEGVLDLSPFADGSWPVDVLQSLVDKSLVRAVGDSRFDLLVSVQDYAAEHLRSEGRYPGSGAAAHAGADQRHGAFFARRKEDDFGSQPGKDLGNLNAACRRAVQRCDAVTALATLEGAWSVLRQRGPFAAGVELAQSVASMANLQDAGKARLAHVAGHALNAAGLVVDAQRHLQLGLELSRSSRQPAVEVQVLMRLGELHLNLASGEAAQSFFAQALAIARSEGFQQVECVALNGLGSAASDLGRMDVARAYYQSALQSARAAGDRRWEGLILGNIGALQFNEGELDGAAQHFRSGLEIAREYGDRKAEGNALCNLAALDQIRGQVHSALDTSREALRVAREIGDVRLECTVHCNLGLVHMDKQDWSSAELHFASALSMARQVQDRRSEGLFLAYLGQLHARTGRFEEGRKCLDAGEGLLRQASDRLSLGLLMCRRVELEVLDSRHDLAAGALQKARAIGVELGAGPQSEFGQSLLRVSRLLEDPFEAQR
jgi:predicted ATPase/class 3 adenylate cyclase/Tfp pilus assembly protein PilF